MAFCQKPVSVDPVGEAVEVDRSTGEVREHRRRHGGVVADEVSLGQRRTLAAAAGEQDLVEVGELQGVLAELPLPRLAERIEGLQLVGGRGSGPGR